MEYASVWKENKQTRSAQHTRDKATILTTIFTIVDDTMKGSAVIQQALKRPGLAPRLSDSELIAIALSQELIGEPREDHFF